MTKFKELFTESVLQKMIYKGRNYFTVDKAVAAEAVKMGAKLQSDSDWREMKSDWKAMEGNLRDFSSEIKSTKDLK